jgi:hypothetical protein
MFTWIIRIAVFCFMAWTMSIPGTECYISPLHWSILIFIYWFATHPMHETFYFTRTDRRR